MAKKHDNVHTKDVRFVDLEGSQELGKALGSQAAKKIIAYATKHPECTATQIATALQMPLSSVQHQLKVLLQAGVIKTETFSYSQKGRKIDHYTVTDDIIVVLPATTPRSQVTQALKALLPSALVIGGLSILGSILQLSKGTRTNVYLANEYATNGATIAADTAVEEATLEAARSGASSAIQAAPTVAQDTVQNTSTVIKQYVAEVVPQQTSLLAQPEFYLGVLAGVVLVVLCTYTLLRLAKRK